MALALDRTRPQPHTPPCLGVPPKMRVLYITPPKRTGGWLAEAFAADSASQVHMEETVGCTAGLSRLRDEAFDVLHLHEPMVPGPTMTALVLKQAPIVATFHRAGESRSYHTFGRGLRWLDLGTVDAEPGEFDQAGRVVARPGVDGESVPSTPRHQRLVDQDFLGMQREMPGRGEPFEAVPALARAARRAGAVIRENCAVRTLDVEGGRITGVDTETGRIACAQVVLAEAEVPRAMAEAWSPAGITTNAIAQKRKTSTPTKLIACCNAGRRLASVVNTTVANGTSTGVITNAVMSVSRLVARRHHSPDRSPAV